MATIRDGRRCSAADAFLHPVTDRPNLTVALHTVVDGVVLEGDRAVGVRGRQNGQDFQAVTTGEAILAAGSIATPRILQLSGIGPAADHGLRQPQRTGLGAGVAGGRLHPRGRVTP